MYWQSQKPFLPFVRMCIIVLSFNIIRASPVVAISSLTFKVYPNTTFTATPTTTTENFGCTPKCTRAPIKPSAWLWSPVSLSATITLETIVRVVNRRNNHTRTETITNAAANLTNYTKTAQINRFGTQTVSFNYFDGAKQSPVELAFPTRWSAYPTICPISGTLPTSVNGHTTCIRAGRKHPATFTIPSYPSLPFIDNMGLNETEIKQRLEVDPEGRTFTPVTVPFDSNELDRPLSRAFPDLGIWDCEITFPKDRFMSGFAGGGGPRTLQSTLFLTATSTSIEDGNDDEGSITTSSPIDLPLSRVKMEASSAPEDHPPLAAQGPVSKVESGSKPTKVPAPGPRLSSQPEQTTVPEKSPQNQDKDENPTRLDENNKHPQLAGSASNIEPGEKKDDNNRKELKPVPKDGAVSPPSLSVPDRSPPPIFIGGQAITPDAAAKYVIAGQTLAVGSRPIVISAEGATARQTIALRSSGSSRYLIVDGSTSAIGAQSIAIPTLPPFIVVKGNTISANAASQYVVSGETLTAGGSITIGSGSSKTIVTLQTDIDGKANLVIGSSTSALSIPNPTTPPPIFINDRKIQANSASQYIISGQTLTLGGSIHVGSGPSKTIIALQTNADGKVNLVIGSSTSSLSSPNPTPLPIIINDRTIQANSASQYIISGKTLSLGGSSITIGTGSSRTVIALETLSGGRTALVIGSSTSLLPPSITSNPILSPTRPPPIVINGRTITANAASQYIVSGQTLVPGSTIVIGTGSSTTRVALETEPGGAIEVIIGSTSSLIPPSSPSSINRSGSGSGGGGEGGSEHENISGSTAAAASTQTYTGGAGRKSEGIEFGSWRRRGLIVMAFVAIEYVLLM